MIEYKVRCDNCKGELVYKSSLPLEKFKRWTELAGWHWYASKMNESRQINYCPNCVGKRKTVSVRERENEPP